MRKITYSQIALLLPPPAKPKKKGFLGLFQADGLMLAVFSYDFQLRDLGVSVSKCVCRLSQQTLSWGMFAASILHVLVSLMITVMGCTYTL